ncbi:FkbM family methyltransferase [uncultured Gimesia sp.]|uniref:FkbM family methyltransferase n=1 Tax=uncultured Gimesia sp. TaxID=1678688 RepID=UPI00260ADC4F|nr:FkbM family methyltransferase [uncultured Gimesia sp.]
MRLHRRIPQIFGYDLIHIKRNHPTLESHLKFLFQNLKTSIVLDVGANRGQFGKLLREMGYAGYIISFEPLKEAYLQLTQASAGDEKWHTYNCALGAVSETTEINFTSASEFTSFLNPSDYGKEVRSAQVQITQKETVEVKKLDDLFVEVISKCAGANHQIFLKMDTQGFDQEVIKGAEKSIDQIDGLQSEIAILPLYDGMPDYVESLAAFREKGFELTGLFPVSRDQQSLILIEMDCVMRRKA